MPEVFILRIEQDLKDSEYVILEQFVSPDKRAKLRKFHQKADAHRGLLGDILVHYAINKATNISCRDQMFSLNEYGKPLFQNNPKIHFNLSHAGKYVVCALDNNSIGIDVEEIKDVDLGIASRFFSENEKQYIYEASLGMMPHRFFNVWTMKESYIKREGKGLSIPLTSFDVLNMSNIQFYKVFENTEAVCHICMVSDNPPVCNMVTIEGLLKSLFSTLTPQR